MTEPEKDERTVRYEGVLQETTGLLLRSAAAEARALHARNEAIRTGADDPTRMRMAVAHRDAEAVTAACLEKLVTTHLSYLEGS